MNRTLTRRTLLASGGAALTAGLLAACTRGTSPTPAPTQPQPLHTVSPDSKLQNGALFVSGASCIGAADGQFAAWRQKPSRIAATWAADGGLSLMNTEWRNWPVSLDFAPQYRLDEAGGFSWAAMARGEFDSRLKQDLKDLKKSWGSRTTALNYRFQHEFNGDWYPWSVSDSNKKQFISGWRRFAELFRAVMKDDPRFRLVWSPNGGTASKLVSDVRAAWPGADYVDVIGIDYYDFFTIRTTSDWQKQVTSTDSGGGPIGIEAWRRFAEDQGKPIALPEWGNQYGDNPLFIQVVQEFLAEHPVIDPTDLGGKVLYEIYFNQRLENGTPSTEGDFRVMIDGKDSTLRPNAAAKYRDLWAGWGEV